MPLDSRRRAVALRMAPLANISKQDGAPELRRRSQLLFIFIVVAFLGLITRLVFLQIVEGERFTYLSENNRIRIKRVPGTRG
jgi:cell division protein FtsI/penicillin-binding protein 2